MSMQNIERDLQRSAQRAAADARKQEERRRSAMERCDVPETLDAWLALHRIRYNRKRDYAAALPPSAEKGPERCTDPQEIWNVDPEMALKICRDNQAALRSASMAAAERGRRNCWTYSPSWHHAVNYMRMAEEAIEIWYLRISAAKAGVIKRSIADQ